MTPERKTYLIDGKTVTLKNYEDLTVKEEEQINKILDVPDREVIIDPLSFIPLITETEENDIDYKNVSYKTVMEILTDYLASRTLFLMNMPGLMKSLLGRKTSQIQNMEENMEMSASSNQN